MKKQNRITFLNILSTVILTGISFISSPLFSRLLGTSGYGIMSTYTVWVNVMTIVSTAHTQSTLVYARVKYPAEEQVHYQSAVATLSLVSFLFICSVILVFIKPISGLLKLSYGLIAMLMVQSFGSFAMSFLNTKLQYELKAGRNMITSVAVVLVSMGLSLLLVLSMPQENRYIGRILGNMITYGVFGSVAIGFVLVKGKTFFRWEYWKFCLGLVFPLIFMDLSNLALGHSDLVMVRDSLGDSAGGIYGLAYTFSGVIFTLFVALNKTWIPFFFDDMKAEDHPAVEAKSANFMELFTVLAVGFVLLTKEVFHIFASSVYWDGTVLIPVFVLSYYLNFLCTFPVNFEHYHLKVHAVSVVTVLSAIINIVLNYVFIKKYGLAGAAVATMLSHLFQFVVHQSYCVFMIGRDGYPFHMKKIIKYPTAFLAALLLTFALDKTWIIRWGVGALVGVWELARIRNRKVII